MLNENGMWIWLGGRLSTPEAALLQLILETGAEHAARAAAAARRPERREGFAVLGSELAGLAGELPSWHPPRVVA